MKQPKQKKCKNCKQLFTPIRSTLEKYCKESECVRVWVAEEKDKQWKKMKAEKKAQLLTVQDWIKITQATFNKYIRLRDKDKGCISCGVPLVGKYDAGHFYSAGGHYAVRFNPDNVHGQCVACNQHKHGNLLAYRKGLIERIGQTAYAWLEDYATDTRKFTVAELMEINELYKAKIKNLK